MNCEITPEPTEAERAAILAALAAEAPPPPPAEGWNAAVDAPDAVEQ